MTYVQSALSSVKLRQLQNVAHDWCVEVFPHRTGDPIIKALKFAEEAGEVAGAVVKRTEGRKTTQDIKDEMGDVLITLAILAQELEIDLEEALINRWSVIQMRTYKESNGTND